MRILFEIRMDGGWKEMGPTYVVGGDKIEITDDRGEFALVHFEADTALEYADKYLQHSVGNVKALFRQVKDVVLRVLLRRPTGTSLPGKEE